MLDRLRPDPVQLRVALPAGLAWGGAALLIGAPSLVPVVAAVAAALAAAAILLLRSGRRSDTSRWSAPLAQTVLEHVALTFALLAAIALAAGFGGARRWPPALDDAADRPAEMVLRTEETLHPGDQAPWSAVIVRLGGASADVPALVLDTRPDLDAAVPIGAEIALRARAVPAEPGEERAVLLDVLGDAVVASEPGGVAGAAHALREGFRAAAADLPGDGGMLLPGLAIGDTAGLDPALEEAMRVSALSHLTAVSGANCAIVVALIMLLGGALRLPRAARILLALAALGGFVVLVTPEPSVQRAAAMAALVLIALARGRPAGGLPMLGAAIALLLLFDPWLARSYAFALSVLATAGLLLLTGPLTALLSRILPTALAAGLAVPAAAQIACQPVLLLLDPVIPLYGVPANLLAAPAAPIATVVGLLGCLALPLLPNVGVALLWVAWAPAAWIGSVARTAEAAPSPSLPWLAGALGVLLFVLVAVAGLALLLGRHRRRERWYRALLGGSAGLLVLAVAIAAGGALGRAVTRPADWSIALCDIGQGDAVLLRSESAVALIDTGPDPEPLAACLSELGIQRIDLLVLTHFDADHVDGTEAVLGRVDRVITGPPLEPDHHRLLEQLAAGGATVDEGASGDTGSLGGLDWLALWPPPGGLGITEGNDLSLVLRFAPRAGEEGASVLLLGDLGELAQRLLLGRAPPGSIDVDVVKVAHHGSADQAPPLYAAASPSLALIGVGENGYGHPAPSILDELEALGAAVLRSDTDGLAVVSVELGALRLWTERGG
ncbi:MAG: ComEC/Rec2 family competence protein [Microbacteriaceae bacterium]